MRTFGGRAIFVALVLCLLAVPLPVAAHGVTESADLSFAQTLAGNELTVVIRRTPDVPGPLRVDIIAHSPVSAVRLAVGVRAADGSAANETAVVLRKGRAGVYPLRLTVAGVGEHVLEISGAGEKAALPFRVLQPRPAVWEWIAYGGFAVTGILVLGSLGLAVLAMKRNSRGLRHSAVAQAIIAGVVIVVAVTSAGLSGYFRPTPPNGALPAEPLPEAADGSWQRGRPYVTLMTDTTPARARAGAPVTIRLRLADGATGRPVDDLVIHHAALAHTVVVSADGGFFRHVHPIRVGPGELAVTIRPDRGGPFRVFTEFERQDSGAQLVSGVFQVQGKKNGGVQTAALPLRQNVGDLTDVTVRTSGKAVAGRPVTLTADVRVAGRPTTDLQPWLGMAGHLLLVAPGGDFFGHVHELRSMAESVRRAGRPDERQPDETVARYGPRLEFTYTFGRPGRYSGWLQFARDFRVVTVPFAVTVHGEGDRKEVKR